MLSHLETLILHPTDAVQGFGISQQVFCNANGVCIDRHIACRYRRCIYVCPACGRYKASQCAFQIWKSFCDQDRPFSSFTWCGRLFFCSGSFRICNRSKQGELVPTHDFWIWFYKSDFKNDCWASPKPDIQHKNALVSHLNDRWISKFLGEKFVFGKSSLIHLILHKTGTITSGFESKKRK